MRFIKPYKTWLYNGFDLLSAESFAYKNAVCATKWGHYSLSFHCILGFMHTLFCAQVMPICLWSKYQLRNLFRCAHLSCLALPTWNFVRYNKRNRIICICNKLSWGSNFKNCSRNKMFLRMNANDGKKWTNLHKTFYVFLLSVGKLLCIVRRCETLTNICFLLATGNSHNCNYCNY